MLRLNIKTVFITYLTLDINFKSYIFKNYFVKRGKKDEKYAQQRSLSHSVNPKHSISERFKASKRGFYHFREKFESERNTPFSVILGFIPRIHTKQSSVDTRVKPEYDSDLMVDTWVTPEYDNRIRMCFKPEYDGKRNLIKGLQCIETTEIGVAIPYAKNQLLFSIKRYELPSL